ncbi:MAG: DUF1559 domain-containing protein [Pirellulaceae bacterium]|nr:DUF1559 domain-containing protein [Pirellulaceae bacterium]
MKVNPFAIALTLLVTCISTAVAQQPAPASIYFEIQSESIKQSPLASIFWDFVEVRRVIEFDHTPRNAKSVRGIVALPDNFMTVVERNDKYGIDLYLEMPFDESQNSVDWLDGIRNLRGLAWKKTVLANGKTVDIGKLNTINNAYFFIGPDNLLGYATDSFKPDAKNFDGVSPLIKQVLANRQSDQVFAVFDFVQARPLINSFIELLERELPPDYKRYLKLLTQIESVRIEGNLDRDPFFQALIATPKTADTESMKSLLAELLQLYREYVVDGEFDDVGRLVLNGISIEAGVGEIRMKLTKTPELAKAVELRQMQSAEAEVLRRYREVAVGFHNYADTFRRFPFLPHANYQHEKLSWRVRILPFINENRLAEQFDMNQPWDSAQNRPLANKVPQPLGQEGKSDIRWVKSDVRRFADVVDGTSNTIACLAGGSPVPWTEANDLTQDEAVELYTNLAEGETIIVIFYDGSVRKIPAKRYSAVEFRALLTPQGGEVVILD